MKKLKYYIHSIGAFFNDKEHNYVVVAKEDLSSFRVVVPYLGYSRKVNYDNVICQLNINDNIWVETPKIVLESLFNHYNFKIPQTWEEVLKLDKNKKDNKNMKIYNRDSKGKFSTFKTAVDSLRFFTTDGSVWGGNKNNKYVAVTNSMMTKARLFTPGAVDFANISLNGWNENDLIHYCANVWVEMTKKQVEKEIPWFVIPSTWEELQNYSRQEKLEKKDKYVTVQDLATMISEVGESAKQSISETNKLSNSLEKLSNIVDKLTLSDIKIGSLYWNYDSSSCVRIIDIQDRLIYVSWHKDAATPYGINSLRKATDKEIEYYLEESKRIHKRTDSTSY